MIPTICSKTTLCNRKVLQYVPEQSNNMYQTISGAYAGGGEGGGGGGGGGGGSRGFGRTPLFALNY